MGGFIGGGRGINNARTFVRLKPLAERKVPAQMVVERLGAPCRRCPARACGCSWIRTSVSAAAVAVAAGTSTRCWPTTRASCGCGPSACSKALKQLPELTGIEDELVSSQQVALNVDRAEARRLGVEMTTVTQALNNAFGQRQVSTIYNALNQYRVVMEVAPEFAQGPEALDRLYVISARAAGAAVGVQPLRAHGGRRTASATRAVRVHVDLVRAEAGRQPEPGAGVNRPRRGAARHAGRRCRAGCRATRGSSRQMQGNQPLAILGTLLIVYIVLGVLYESYMHPLTILSTLPSAGVGALLALQLLDTEFSLIAMLGLFLLIGVVMKNAILMIDVALQLERETRPDAGGRDPRGVPAPPAADPDDDDGGAARRAAARDRCGRRPRAAAAARHRDRRRPARQPGADALHDARRLSLSRIACACGARGGGRW